MTKMSYNPMFEASKALPVDYIAKELEQFAETGQDLSGRRFSRSPPRVSSIATTAYEESQPPSPNEQLQDKESNERDASSPGAQFSTQITDELGRIRAARDKNLLQYPDVLDLEEAAEANVKYRWIQQGIWDKRWDGQFYKVWKHEFEDPSLATRLSNIVEKHRLESKQRRKHADLEEEYHEIVRCAVDYQRRQSSRPCYQFLDQVCQHREWIKMGLCEQDEDQDQQTDLDTRAYEIVKSRWIQQGIWDDDWHSVPGMSWRHERPRKTPDPHGNYRWDDEQRAAEIEQAERPPRWYFMAPVAPLMRINWPSIRPGSPSPEATSDPSSPSALESNSKVMPPTRDRNIRSQTCQNTDLPRFTRNSTAKAKRSTKHHKQNEPQIKFNPKEEVLQRQKANTSRLGVAEGRPVKKRIPAKKEKHRPRIPAAVQKETINDAKATRPRRAAALKAMKNMANTT